MMDFGILTDANSWRKKLINYEKVKSIYVRSILLFSLLINYDTGGISSAIEVDENQTKSGRYSYCWPRDAIFITKALDILNMKKEADKFYLEFAKNTQLKNGMWEQRYYTDERLAPCWGYQIDETASIVYGVYQHYNKTKDIKFLEDTYLMCKNAIKALTKYIEIVLFDKKASKEYEIFEKYKSYDLWEMNEGIHLYSLSAIYAAINSMIKIEQILSKNKESKNTKQVDEFKKLNEKIKQYVLDNFISPGNILKRNKNDELCDISLLRKRISI